MDKQTGVLKTCPKVTLFISSGKPFITYIYFSYAHTSLCGQGLIPGENGTWVGTQRRFI